MLELFNIRINNRLMTFCINEFKLLEKYKTIWTKLDNLSNIELNADN